jgi:hypothetical protein
MHYNIYELEDLYHESDTLLLNCFSGVCCLYTVDSESSAMQHFKHSFNKESNAMLVFKRFGGTLPLFFIYFYINRADIQYFIYILVEHHSCFYPRSPSFAGIS